MKGGEHMTKEERLLRQEQRERAKAIEAAAREAGRGPLDLPYLLLVLMLVGVGLIMLFSASFPSAYYGKGQPGLLPDSSGPVCGGRYCGDGHHR